MFVSYSQNLEDVVLWRALKEVENGFYIDVGAAWPTMHNVTKAFYDLGWTGINVEPNPALLAALQAERPRDCNLGCALGSETREVALHIVDNPGLTTAVEDIAERHTQAGFSVAPIAVPMTTMAEICASHVAKGQEIHFLKVDVEGMERAVLAGNDWSLNRPWIVVVEAMEPMRQVENHDAWESVLTGAGYRYIYADGLNRFYLAAERECLASHFRYPPNVFDGYAIAPDPNVVAEIHRLNQAIADREVQHREELSAQEERLREENETDVSARLAELERTHRFEMRRFEIAAHKAEQALARDLLVVRRERDALASDNLQLRRERDALSAELLHLRPILHGAPPRTDTDFGVPSEWQRRGVVGRLAFRKNGRPHKPLRLLLFRSSGRPRTLTRRLVLHRDGRLRGPFRQWMTSGAYLDLPDAYRE